MFIILFVIVLAVLYLLNGVALNLLWGWFMVPTFGLPAISLAQAVGLTIIINFLTHQYIPFEDDNERKKFFAYEIATPVFAIVVGYIIHRMFM